VISLSDPVFRATRPIETGETGEHCVDLGDIGDLILMDRMRKVVSNPNRHFLKVRASVAVRISNAVSFNEREIFALRPAGVKACQEHARARAATQSSKKQGA
jgi:hypothetical protein